MWERPSRWYRYRSATCVVWGRRCVGRHYAKEGDQCCCGRRHEECIDSLNHRFLFIYFHYTHIRDRKGYIGTARASTTIVVGTAFWYRPAFSNTNKRCFFMVGKYHEQYWAPMEISIPACLVMRQSRTNNASPYSPLAAPPSHSLLHGGTPPDDSVTAAPQSPSSPTAGCARVLLL